MNKTKLTLILILSIFSITVFSQNISPEIISPAGEIYEGADVQINWTLGEIAINTIQSSELIITQGFHQPNYIITNISEPNMNISDVKVYPNPSTDFILIDIDLKDEKKVEIQLIDMNGHMLWTKNIKGKTIREKIEVSTLPSGIYITNLFIEKEVQNFKILKKY